MTVLSIAGFALGLNTMRDRGGVALLTKVFWRFGTLVERVSETNYHLHSSFVLMASLVRATDDIRVRVVRLVLGLIPSRAYEKEISVEHKIILKSGVSEMITLHQYHRGLA